MTAENKLGVEATELVATLISVDKLQAQDKYIQVITSDLMAALKTAAHKDQVSVDIEVVNRLLATIIEPNALGFSPALDEIARKKFIAPQVALEKRINQEAWGRLFELEKLTLYLRFKQKMPKKYKEQFSIIDVEKEAKRIKAILAEEQRIDDELDAKANKLL